MLNENTLVTVKNITGSPVIYQIPELSVRRQFNTGEQKKVSIKELRALSYLPGGMVLLKDYLSVNSDEFLVEVGINPEPEYSWTEKDVKNLLLSGTLARLQDCLDYAPKGIIELVKSLAVSMKINDLSKREAIFASTGFNVTKAIEANDLSETDADAQKTPATRTRRVPVAMEETKSITE